MIVRTADVDDLPAMHVLAALAWEENEPMKEMTPAFDRAEEALLNDRSLGTFVAEIVDGSLVGMFVARLEWGWYFKELVVANLIFYVMPAYRGTAIPHKLLGAMEGWAVDNGAAQLHVSTIGAHLKERHTRLFSSFGYNVTGITAVKTLLPGVDNVLRRRR